MNKSVSELKREVKAAYRGKWWKMIKLNLVPSLLVFLAAFLIFAGVAFFSSSFISQQSYNDARYSDTTVWDKYDDDYYDSDPSTALIFSYIANSGSNMWGFLWTLLIGFLTIGILFTTLDVLRNPRRTISPFRDTFRIFNQKDFVPILLLQILMTLFTFLWSLLFVIPGIIKYLAYSQSTFIYKDLSENSNQANVSVVDYISESRALMNGHKGRLFYLHISFIGWYFLIVFTFGIAALWVYPYYTGVQAAFYKDLAKDKYAPQEVIDEDAEWTEF